MIYIVDKMSDIYCEQNELFRTIHDDAGLRRVGDVMMTCILFILIFSSFHLKYSSYSHVLHGSSIYFLKTNAGGWEHNPSLFGWAQWGPRCWCQVFCQPSPTGEWSGDDVLALECDVTSYFSEPFNFSTLVWSLSYRCM